MDGTDGDDEDDDDELVYARGVTGALPGGAKPVSLEEDDEDYDRDMGGTGRWVICGHSSH